MPKLSHAQSVFISGFVWICVGFFLLQFGVGLLQQASLEKAPILRFLHSYVGGKDEIVVVAMTIALYLGFLKGKYVLRKSAQKGIAHITSQPNPLKLSSIYSKKYYLLLGVMMAMGSGMKVLGLPDDVRGVIDVTVASALINGAVYYFRCGWQLRNA